MVNQSDEPLVKVTLNLYEADVVYLQSFRHKKFAELVRSIVRDWINEVKGPPE